MVKAPWLSVVIPVFRAEHSVSDAIASVTDQDIDGVEIICVDDCSPDNSWSVLESLQRAHPSLRLIRQETNQGPGPTRNTGIEAADGD
jgi:glycosyltransferase involved in cell wall biosynthesis